MFKDGVCAACGAKDPAYTSAGPNKESAKPTLPATGDTGAHLSPRHGRAVLRKSAEEALEVGSIGG